MDREDPEGCVACGEVASTDRTQGGLRLCKECLITREGSPQGLRIPPPAAPGAGMYRLGSYWADTACPDL